MSLAFALTLALVGMISQDESQITRHVPPVGMALPQETHRELEESLDAIESSIGNVADKRQRADIEILAKAVRYALLHGEFYRDEDIDKARELLKLADARTRRASQLSGRDQAARGLLVRGYESSIDGSVQPYGLEIPADIDLSKPVPLYVWLHGRGDRTTDLHFIHERLHRPGQIHPPHAIVLHPFGRQCIGFKSAGEIDVLEAIADVSQDYPIDPQRIVLMGFSMGGAGVWHMAAHYPDRWVAASPGAGFAETAEYNHLQPDDYPPAYVQTLWKVYDVPNYTLNLLNFPIVAYSGENDKQIQAARVMERAFKSEWETLDHIIGPGMGHQYHPDSLKEILAAMGNAVEAGKPLKPRRFWIQTPTLRYSVAPGVELLQLKHHWSDARLIGGWLTDDELLVSTKNVTAFRLTAPVSNENVRIVIDGQTLPVSSLDPANGLAFILRDGEGWTLSRWPNEQSRLHKQPGLQGPIDDAFLEPFLVVIPSGTGFHPETDAWTRAELDYFQRRWRYLFRGELRIKKDTEVTADDHENFNLILWGDPQSNHCLRDALEGLPLQWDSQHLTIGTTTVDAQTHLPLLIFPNPKSPDHYVVLNSGPTFRDGHDRTNSLQNPQLPDWAVLDIRSPRTEFTPGKIVNAGFFDESWRIPRSDD